MNTFFTKAKARLELSMAEKIWRMDVQSQIENSAQSHNRAIMDVLNIRHSKFNLRSLFNTAIGKKDIKLFTLKRWTGVEEDVFRYFYPFCLINCLALTAFIFRKNSPPALGVACLGMVEYVYFLFSFPVEAFHFHKRALSTNLPHA